MVLCYSHPVFDDRNSAIDSSEAIQIYGAREHNLKDLTLSIPRNCFVVITGVSGSGKSTLAFDLLFAEGQRRFLGALNTYPRQFVAPLARPDVDILTRLSPAHRTAERIRPGRGQNTLCNRIRTYHIFHL